MGDDHIGRDGADEELYEWGKSSLALNGKGHLCSHDYAISRGLNARQVSEVVEQLYEARETVTRAYTLLLRMCLAVAPDDTLISVSELAVLLRPDGPSSSLVYQLKANGKIPSTTHGRTVLFRAADVRAFLSHRD